LISSTKQGEETFIFGFLLNTNPLWSENGVVEIWYEELYECPDVSEFVQRMSNTEQKFVGVKEILCFRWAKILSVANVSFYFAANISS
jgi:hypothetical protein